jgi:hypothetical protein
MMILGETFALFGELKEVVFVEEAGEVSFSEWACNIILKSCCCMALERLAAVLPVAYLRSICCLCGTLKWSVEEQWKHRLLWTARHRILAAVAPLSPPAPLSSP